MRRLLSLSLLSLCLADPGAAWATDVRGELLADAEWGPQGNPWVVTGDVVVPEDLILTIEAGAIVQFDLDDLEERGTNRTELVVAGGALIMAGTPEAPVTLTSLANNPVRGQWEGITVDSGGVADLQHTRIEWAVGGVVAEDGAELLLTGVTVRQSSAAGVRAHDGAEVTISGGTFSSNTSQGVRVGEGNHSMRNAIVFGNGGIGVYVLMADAASTFLGDHLTLVGNSSGAYLSQGDHRTQITLKNSVVARNAWGIRGAGQAQAPESHHNDVWDNQGGTRDWQEGARKGEGSLSGNPLFVDIDDVDELRPTENSPVRGLADDGRDIGALDYTDDPTVGLHGILRGNRTLPAGEHRILGDLTVPDGVTLTLDPGAEVRFATTDSMESGADRARSELIVEGALEADGDPEGAGRIVLRSAHDVPARGHWYGVRFAAAGQFSLSGVDVMHGRTCVRAEAGAALELDDVVVSDCSGEGVVAQDGSAVEIYDSIVRDCATHGIDLNDGAHQVSQVVVHRAGSAGVNVVVDEPESVVSLERLTLYGNTHGVLTSRNNQGASLELRDLLVARNSSYGVYAIAGSVALDHVLTWDNTNGSRDLAGAIDNGPLVVRSNPLLADPVAGDFRLTHRSPAIGVASDGDDLGAIPFDGDLQTPRLMGILRDDLTLTAADSPHLVTGDIIVPEGVTLTVEPGAVVQLGPGDAMEAGIDRSRVEVTVHGSLHSAGTEQDRIQWTSGAGAPGRGDWHSVLLAQRSTGTAWRHADLAYAVRGLTVLSDDEVSISDSTFRECMTEVMVIAGDGDYEVVGCDLSRSSSDGLRIDDLDRNGVPDGGAGTVTIRDSIFRRNSSWGLLAYQDHPDARVHLDHVTVWANSGGGILANRQSPESEIRITSSISARNGYGIYGAGSLPLVLSNNDAWDNTSRRDWSSVVRGEGSVSLNPLFVDGDVDDLRLTERSPCRGQGVDDTDMGALPYDGDASPQLMGVLTEDLTLTDREAPWLIEGDLIVPEGITLTVEPGAVVAMSGTDGMEAGRDTGRVEIRVYGSLAAAGEAERPVVFRSAVNAAAAGAWYGIQLLDGSVGNVLSDVEIEHAYHPLQLETDDAVDVDRARLTLIHTSGTGIALSGAGAYRVRDSWIAGGARGVQIGDGNADGTADGDPVDVEVTGTTFTRMANSGVYSLTDHPESRVLLDHNTAHRGAGIGMYVVKGQEGSDVVVTNNVTVSFGYGLYRGGAATPEASNNVSWGNTSRRNFTGWVEAPGFVARPLWVDGDGGDYRPTERSPLRESASDGSDVGAWRYDGEPTADLLGWLRADVVLHDREQPWVLTGDLYVPEGITLTVEAGAELVLGPGDAMSGGWDTGRVEVIVEGSLRLLGLPAAPVTLSSGAGAPAGGDWRGIRLRPGSEGHVFDNAHLHHAYDPVRVETDAAVTFVSPRITAVHSSGVAIDMSGPGQSQVLDGWIEGGAVGVRIGDGNGDAVADGGPVDVVVRGTVFRNMVGSGVLAYTDDAGASVIVDHNTVTGRGSGYGIGLLRQRQDGEAEITNNVVVGFAYGIRQDGTFPAELTHNVSWGNTSRRNFSRMLGAEDPGREENPLWVDRDGGEYAPTHMSPLRLNDSGGADIGAVPFAGDEHPLIAGWVHEDLTLTAEGSPWLISGDVTVPEGRSLTIEPGVEVRVSPLADLMSAGVDRSRVEVIVAGVLRAVGAPDAPITMLPDAAVPGRSNWYGLRFVQASAGSALGHLQLRYPMFGVVHDSAGALAIEDVVIDEVGDCAVLAHADAGPLSITRSTFSHVSNYGLRSFNSDVSVTSTVAWSVTYGLWSTLSGVEDRLEYVHNTVHGAQYGLRVDKQQEASSAVVRNNLVTNVTHDGLYCDSAWDPALDHNAFHDWGRLPVRGIEAEAVGRLELADPPAYASQDVGDLRLTAESPVIDLGSPDGAPARDRSGRPRSLPGTLEGAPVPDIGAFEYDPGFPVVLALTPSRVQQGQSVAVRLLGETLPEAPQLDFGAGVQVQDLVRVSDAELTFGLVVDEAAVVGIRDLVMTWDGGETEALQVLTIISGPQVQALDPAEITQGRDAVVTVTGRNFLPGLRVTVDGGVNAGRVRGRDVRPGEFPVYLAVPVDSAPGAKSFTVTNPDGGVVTVDDALLVRSAIVQPQIDAVAPAVMARGVRDAELTVTGEGFQPGAVVRIPGPGLGLGATRFVDEQTLTVAVDIAEHAPVGARDLRVDNPDGGTARAVRAFTIDSGLVVEAVDPDSLLLGDLGAPINVYGQRFNETAELSFVGPAGAGGVVATEVAVLGSTRLLVTLDVDPDAAEGLYDVVVSQGDDRAVGEQLLSIGAGGPVRLARAEPAAVGQGAVDHRVVLRGTNLGQPDDVRVSGPGVSVAGFDRLGASAIAATVNVEADALAGPRDVTVVFDDGSSVQGPGILEVVGAPVIDEAVPPTLALGAVGVEVALLGERLAPVQVSLDGLGVEVMDVRPETPERAVIVLSVWEDAEPGARTVRLVNVDGGRTVAEGLLAVVRPPTVEGVNPDRALVGTQQRVTVTGEGIRAGATAVLSGRGVDSVDPQVVGDSLQVTFEIDPGAQPGPRDVLVVNVDGGEGTLVRGFELTPRPALIDVDPGRLRRGVQDALLVAEGRFLQPGAEVTFPGGAVTVRETRFVSEDSLDVVVHIDADADLGPHELVVTNPDGGRSDPIGLLTVIGADARQLEAEPESVFFVGSVDRDPPPNQVVEITHSAPPGGGWTAETDTPWIVLVRGEGLSGVDDLLLGIRPELAPVALGTVRGDVRVTDGVETVPVPVTVDMVDGGEFDELVLRPGGLQAIPRQFDLDIVQGDRARPQQLMVRMSAGEGTDFVVTSDQPWVRIDPPGGRSPLAVDVNFDVEGFRARDVPYRAELTVRPLEEGVDERTVQVRAFVRDPAAPVSLVVDPPALLMGAEEGQDPAPAILGVRLNPGGGRPFEVAVQAGGDWLSVAPGAGTTPGTVFVRAAAAALSADDSPYEGSLLVTGPIGAAPVQVPVTLLVGTLPPIADGGEGYSGPPTVVTLDGSASAAAEGIEAYSWTVTGAPAEVDPAGLLSDPLAVVTAALLQVPGDYQFELVVTDGDGLQSAPDRVLVRIEQVPPGADAGVGMAWAMGAGQARLGLRAGRSRDANGDRLGFTWRQVAGAPAAIEAPGMPETVAVVERAGVYVFEVRVDDGVAPSTARVTHVVQADDDHVPVAVAGEERRAEWGAKVWLDGAASADPDGDPLSYVWRQVAGPREVLLEGADTVRPAFQTPASGRFEFELVVSDGMHSSPPARVAVLLDRPDDRVPVAAAGEDREAIVGERVALSAAGSSDPPDDVDGEALTAQWAWGRGPAPPITNPQDPDNAWFHPVLSGVHRVRLTVEDGRHVSSPDWLVVVVDGANTVPRADGAAVATQATIVGRPVALDASELRDADGDPVTARWRQVAGPWLGLDDPARTIVRGTPLLAGRYAWMLSLDDGRDRGPEVEVAVEVADKPNAAPVAVAGDDQVVQVGDLVLLDGGLSQDDDGDELSFEWALLRAPLAVAVKDQIAWQFVAAVPGEYAFSLLVSDGVVASDPDVVVVVAEPEPVEVDPGRGPGEEDGPGCVEGADADEDGLDDCDEFDGDSDRDGVPDFEDDDDDGDGVSSAEEDERGDTDGDGIPDRLDLDDDGDGVNTALELAEGDTDGDGIPDYLDTDDDGDEDPTKFELPRGDSDRDGVADYLDADDTDGPGPTALISSGTPASSSGCSAAFGVGSTGTQPNPGRLLRGGRSLSVLAWLALALPIGCSNATPASFPGRTPCDSSPEGDDYAIGVEPTIPAALAWDGQGMWMASANEPLLRRIDLEAGRTERTCPAPTANATSLSYDEESGLLWLSGSVAPSGDSDAEAWTIHPGTCAATPADGAPSAPPERHPSDGWDFWKADPEARLIRRVCVP